MSSGVRSEPTAPGVDGGHIHAGRILITGGLSVFAGKAGTRSDGRLTVTFRKGLDAAAVDTADTKVCPDCAETVKAAARICRFCRYEFWPADPQAGAETPE